jgi:hypothetical protein
MSCVGTRPISRQRGAPSSGYYPKTMQYKGRRKREGRVAESG